MLFITIKNLIYPLGGECMNCKFCERPTEMMEGIYVCNECCTVSFSKNIKLEQKQKLIEEYLNDIQKKILEQQDYLYTIGEKYNLGEKLSVTEFEIFEKLTEFQSVQLDWEIYINSNSHLNEKDERKLLYRLLVLSKWLSKYFGSFQYNTNIGNSKKSG